MDVAGLGVVEVRRVPRNVTIVRGAAGARLEMYGPRGLGYNLNRVLDNGRCVTLTVKSPAGESAEDAAAGITLVVPENVTLVLGCVLGSVTIDPGAAKMVRRAWFYQRWLWRWHTGLTLSGR